MNTETIDILKDCLICLRFKQIKKSTKYELSERIKKALENGYKDNTDQYVNGYRSGHAEACRKLKEILTGKKEKVTL